MIDFSTIIDEMGKIIFAMGFAMPRMIGIFLLVPFLSAPLVPALVRNGILLGLAMVMVPATKDYIDIHHVKVTDLMTWVVLIKELFIGLVVGYLLSIFFYAVQSAGFFIDNQRGSAIASTVDPLLGQQTSVLGIFLSQLLVVYFFTSGLFLVFVGALYRSFILWPIFSFFPDMSFSKTHFYMSQTDQLFYIALMLSGPIIVAMFVTEMGLALISRFAPQLNVFFLAMPIKSAVAFMILIIYMPFLFSYIGNSSGVIRTIFSTLDGVFR